MNFFQKVAYVLGKSDDAERFMELCKNIEDNFNTFMDQREGKFSLKVAVPDRRHSVTGAGKHLFISEIQ